MAEAEKPTKTLIKFKGRTFDMPEKPSTKTLVMLERKYQIGPSDLEANPRIEYMVFIAWAELKKLTTDVGPFDDAFLEEVELETVELEPDPELEGLSDHEKALRELDGGTTAADPTGGA